MAETLPILRQWLLLKVLSTRRQGVTLRQMAAETGCSQKTIRRDLDTLRQVGFVLTCTESDRGRKHWRLADPSGHSALSFDFLEAFSLYLGRQFLEPLAGTHFWDSARSAFRKIRASLGEQAIQYLEDAAAVFLQTGVAPRDYSRHNQIVDALLIGREDSRAVRVTYHSLQSTEPTTYTLHPYGFIYHRGALYLVAYAPHHKHVRHYRIDRMRAAELTDRRFRPPTDFDLKTHLQAAFGVFRGHGPLQTIRIRFLPPVTRYVQEARWHPSQQLTHEPDGTLIAEFELDDTQEIKRWVLSFGENAIVEQPESLVEEVRREVGRLAAAYDALLCQNHPLREEPTGAASHPRLA